jgi:hypothetical protein
MKFGRGSAAREPMRRREIIVLAMPDIAEPVYYAGRKHVPSSFSYQGVSWLTTDINRAKVWRHPEQAAAVLHGQRDAWASFAPRIIDPRTVTGYVDKPSRTARRNEAQRPWWDLR